MFDDRAAGREILPRKHAVRPKIVGVKIFRLNIVRIRLKIIPLILPLLVLIFAMVMSRALAAQAAPAPAPQRARNACDNRA